MQLPNELIVLLSALVGVLVAQGLKKIGDALGVDLGGHVAGITASLVGVLVAAVNGALNLIPAEYAPYINGLLAFLVIVFAPAGIHAYLKQSRSAA